MRFRKVKGVSVFTEKGGITVMNGRLDPITLDSEAAHIFNLIDGTKDVGTLCDLAERKGIPGEKTKKTLKMLQKAGIIAKGEGIFPEDERIFSDTWGDAQPNYLKMDILPRIHVVQEDSCFQKITFLPSEKREDINFLLKKLLKYASKTPLIEFFGSDTYLDSSHVIELVKIAVGELEHDVPHFFFELGRNIFSKKDLETLKAMTKTQITQGLSSRTLISQIFGEDVLHIGRRFRLHSQDHNISLALRADKQNVEALEFFRQVPGINLFLIAELDEKIESLSKTPYYILLKPLEKITLDNLDTIFNSFNVFFLEDDLYRIQRAIQKCYLPLTDCGAGKRKIAVTLDGNVYPCADAAQYRMYCLGNLRDESVAEIRTGEKAQKVREKIRKNFKKCAEECCLAYYCSGCIMDRKCSRKKEMLSFFLRRD